MQFNTKSKRSALCITAKPLYKTALKRSFYFEISKQFVIFAK